MDFQELFAQRYGRRSLDPDGRPNVVVDDKDDNDISPCFCRLRATFTGPHAFILTAVSLPVDDEVLTHLQSKEAVATISKAGLTTVSITITDKDSAWLRKLAKAVRGVTGPGKVYPLPDWYWVSRRTEASLVRLARVLTEYRRSGSSVKRHAPK